MTIKIDHELAKDILFTEHQNALDNIEDNLSGEWLNRIQKLTELCPYRKSSTFIAAIGTALLAKSVNPNVDVYCLLDRDGEENSYSARSLVDNVWAKNRAYLGVDLGANGANPLNNTPFIGKARIDEIENVRNKQGYDYLIECLNLLKTYKSVSQAKSALRGFISARRVNFQASFKVGGSAGDHLVIPSMLEAIRQFVFQDSEDGRRAQAVAAGLLSIAFGYEFIDVGHVNDPDRHFPLDIAVFSELDGNKKIRIAVEVKDKPISGAEILSSLEKALSFQIQEIIYLAISQKQIKNSFLIESERARDMGCRLVIYTDWESFIKACFTFSQSVLENHFSHAYKMIGQYSELIGVSQNGIDLWKSFES